MGSKRDNLARYRELVKSIRIDHQAYGHVLEELEDAYDSVGCTANPLCLHISGEYRTGKSCVIEDFLALHPHSRDAAGRKQSIVYARVPHDATVKALVQALLLAFGDPQWARGSIANQTARLLDYLVKTNCRMIILDEFQHLSDKGQKKQLYKTSDWLKNLIEGRRWALVAAGLPESASVINSNRQLQGRFDATLTLPLFDWRNACSRAQFRAIVRAFTSEMHPFELPDLSGEELAFRTFLATTGRVGLFAKLMDRAVRTAIRRETTKIRLDDLSEAFDRAIWFAPRFPVSGGPFLGAFPKDPGELIQRVITLGAETAGYEEEQGHIRLQGVDANASSGKREGGRLPKRTTHAAHKEALRRAL